MVWYSISKTPNMDLDQYILAKQIKRRCGQVMGIKQTDQSKKGKLEYRDVATAAIGEMAAHMLISSFLAGGPATTYLPAAYRT